MKSKDISKSTANEQHDYLSVIKTFENRMENIFQNFWQNPFDRENIPDIFSRSFLSSMPKMDVIDRDKEIFVKAELPGFDKKDLDISITSNQLIIKAKACHEEKEENGDYLKQEISKSEIYRSVPLPADVDDDSKIKTSFKNGVLELTIPKHKKSHRRRIEVE